jgi:hypothetical protein
VARLELRLACGDYDRTRAIRTDEVKPDGVELNVMTLAPEEMFYRMARFREFDLSELSLSTYTVLRGRGEPLVAIPVFPSFSFRHSSVFVGTRAGIKARDPGRLHLPPGAGAPPSYGRRDVLRVDPGDLTSAGVTRALRAAASFRRPIHRVLLAPNWRLTMGW